MLKNNYKSLPNQFRRYLLVVTIVIVTIIFVVTSINEYKRFEKESKDLRKKVRSEQRANLKFHVKSAIDIIDMIAGGVQKKMEEDLKKRVDEAYGIAISIYNTHKGSSSDEDIKLMIRSALRPIRFFNGRGYYFIINTEGKSLLNPYREMAEETSIYNLESIFGGKPIKKIIDCVKTQNSGFVQYYREIPNCDDSKIYKKTSYVRRLPFYNWIIGTGEYIDCIEKELKAIAIEKIKSIRYDEYGYIFIHEFDGRVILSDSLEYSKGFSILNDTDANGVKLFPKMITNAFKPEGGFYTYSWNSKQHKEKRLHEGFVRMVPRWNWIIGGFSDMTSLDVIIEKKRANLIRDLWIYLLFVVSLVGVIIIAVYLISRKMKNTVLKVFNTYNESLVYAVNNRTSIDGAKFDYIEYKRLVSVSNKVLRYGQFAYAKLEDRERELLKSNQTKDRFFSIIAHDLKNPFNNLLGFINILQEDYEELDDIKRRQYISVLQRNSNNVFKLLTNLLEWSRSQIEGVHFKPVSINLLNLINEEIDIFENLASGKNLHIYISVSKDVNLFADKDMIKTIIRNLLSNAIKFTRVNGDIHVIVNDCKNEVEISVEDSGVGMSQEVQDKLFKLDEKISTAGTNNELGTGLGLILCKEFIDKHNGTIRVSSEKGVGSKFCVNLPK